MKYTIRVTLDVPVEYDGTVDPQFLFEENGCPGTGLVGQAIDREMQIADEHSHCWACALNGQNKIINVEAS